ncbi:DUF3231 family protein [Priestia koreensis]|uniref:DUF3231 family protein n=1 Tax=Priestia koreensis TaxID=284581 RepID=UPI00203B49CF|nr:DUF3231 family protein [Priestia koreensis]MCM3005279.1 DUF3231 family protein [Priestia koreensis]
MNNDGRIVTLTAGEVSGLWSGYIGETMLHCVMTSFLSTVEDSNARTLLETNKKRLDERLVRYQKLFEQEGMIAPAGFGEQDVFLDTPRMFSDKFYLFYMKEMARGSIILYTEALFGSHRRDLREFFIQNIEEYTNVFNQAIEYLLEKGIVIRTPSIPIPKEIHFVHHPSFLGKIRGKNRPVTAQEIKSIYINLDTNMLGKSLMIGFSQASTSVDLRTYLVRGRKIAHKHIDLFIHTLTDEDLPSPQLWDPEVTESRIPPFSEKLMLYHTGLASASGLANYGSALSQIARKDLSLMFARLSLETARFAGEGTKIAIEKGWLEQPPLASNRDFLSS